MKRKEESAAILALLPGVARIYRNKGAAFKGVMTMRTLTVELLRLAIQCSSTAHRTTSAHGTASLLAHMQDSRLLEKTQRLDAFEH